ncbi:MAG: hypothetical protein UZ17_ACD001000214 [Acidobacteria bacterium OLB17]|nr:MAG: hypothetical protein UZ17_ACD001000214 [Acidobacteria bacterium OLB17]MCZ2389570.1 DUF402 domain-containing protein [Acidobacteriota bacterium]
MKTRHVTVRSLAFDGTIRREWSGDIVRQDDTRIDLVGAFDAAVEHPDLGRIEAGTVSHEFYWLDRWYNVFRFEHPAGKLRNFYCNIAMPPVLRDCILEYVDLDIDVLVWPGKEAIVLDRDEFEEHAVKLRYPKDTIIKAEESLKEVLRLVALNELSTLT